MHLSRLPLFSSALALSVLLIACQADGTNTVENTPSLGSLPHTMELTSPAFAMGGRIPEEFSCDGEGTNPELNIQGVPEGAQSVALLVSDADAPNGTFYHWVVWSVPGASQAIAANSVPEGAVQGTNSAGSSGYVPPCPPEGSSPHQYHFTVMALDTPLLLPETSTAVDVLAAARDHVLDQAGLVGTYSR